MEWKNLPDRTTPLNAENLNNMVSYEIITGSFDFNNLINEDQKVPKKYKINSSSGTNRPVNNWGWLEVRKTIASSADVYNQWYESDKGEVYYRQKSSSSTEWESWVKVSENNYYKAGDTQSLSELTIAGYVSSSTSALMMDIYLPKKIDNISSITITSGTATIRTTNGGYLDNNSSGFDITKSPYSLAIYKREGNRITIRINKSSAYTNVTNNTPISGALSNLRLTFN